MKIVIVGCFIIFSLNISAQNASTPKANPDSVSVKKNPVKTGSPAATAKTTGKKDALPDSLKSKPASVSAKAAIDTSVSKTKPKAASTNASPKISADSSLIKANSAKNSQIHVSVTSLVGLKVYDANNEQFYLDSLSQGKPTVVIFISIKCLVSGLYNERYNELYNDYVQKATFVFINSNDEESWPEIQKYFKDNSLIFDLVKDKGRATATALNVTKIPTAFIFKADGSLVYRGKIDNNPRVQGTVYGSQLQLNLEKVLNGEEISSKETVAVGCDLVKPEKVVPKPVVSPDSLDAQ